MVLRTLLCCWLIKLVAVGALGKHDSGIDPNLGIPLFLKIVTYDENFDPEEVEAVNISVVYDRGRVRSYEQYRLAETFFKDNPVLRVNGVAVQYEAVPFDQIAPTLEAMSDAHYNLVLVTDIGDERIAPLSREIKTHHVRSFSFNPAYVYDGLSVGVKVAKKGQLIVVNLKSSRQEGSKFSAHLLKLCEIVGGKD
ncbi:MAG: hypothetical protein OEV49_02885 [candidate division Zixibacteria bacterium]|nr:hypothetical protein [candidate division Zixibacteria bacterium]MDH3936791.1 hypothetical protein [candidate division Zixibacteria bacterium]MDH4032438.1 hypothetical protein [candidate division Zixibacteria bacterium]